jgi:hypothetical protein
LAATVSAVGVLRFLRFFGKVKRLLHRWRQDHFQGLICERVQFRVLGHLLLLAKFLVDDAKEGLTVLDSLR